jgi:hypothetical protein
LPKGFFDISQRCATAQPQGGVVVGLACGLRHVLGKNI